MLKPFMNLQGDGFSWSPRRVISAGHGLAIRRRINRNSKHFDEISKVNLFRTIFTVILQQSLRLEGIPCRLDLIMNELDSEHLI